MKKIVVCVLLLVFVAACNVKPDPPLANAKGAKPVASPTIPGPEPVLMSMQPEKDQSQLPVSWEDFLEEQSHADARYLARLDARYFGALSFKSEEEREYMLRAGFPMPEDWLAAKAMSDSQLRDAADSGDRKAAGMYADRMAERLTELFELNDANPEEVDDTERVLTATMAVNYARKASEGSRGAFGVYINGMVKSRMFRSPEGLTAAMLEASRRGDPRAERLIREMAARHPTQRIESIYSFIESY